MKSKPTIFFSIPISCASPELMPGTIQLSVCMHAVLELMGLPQPEPAISSFSLKVTLGKREYQSMGKEDFSFPVTSLLGNLTVMLLDAEGNEMLRTELRTISVVEKGLWIDSFPLKGGGVIQMKLQFSLSQEERIRIREMRENVLKRKRGVHVKTGVKSPLSEQGNNKGITDSVTMGTLHAQSEQEGTDQSEPSDTQSLQVSKERPEHLLDKDVPRPIETNKGALNAESPPDVIAQVQIPSEESLGPRSGTSLSSVLENASQNNSSISAALEEDQNVSSVRKMVNAFESSQFQEHRSHGLRTKYSEDKVDGEGSLERASAEESDIIGKSEPPQTIAKSFSSGMLSEHLVPDIEHEAKGTGKAKLSFKKDQKLKDTSSEPTGSKKPSKSLKFTGLVSETTTKICPNGEGTDDGNVTSKKSEICSSPKDTHSCSRTTYPQRGSALQTVTGEVECSRSLPSEAAELLTCADIEGYPSGNLGIWGPRHLCITTGSRQLRDLAECCRNSRRPPQMENGSSSTGTNHDQKQHCNASVQENENKRITSCTSGKSEHEKSTSVSKSNSFAGLIEQGVRIAVIIVACGTLLLNTKQRKPGKTVPESKRR